MSQTLPEFYKNLTPVTSTPTASELDGFKTISILGDGDCCPTSIIVGILMAGLVSTQEKRDKIADFMMKMSKSASDVAKLVADYRKIKTEQDAINFTQKIDYQNGNNPAYETNFIKTISEALRKEAGEYLKNKDTVLYNLGKGEDPNDDQFAPGVYSSPDIFAAYLIDNGIAVNLVVKGEIDQGKTAWQDMTDKLANPLVTIYLYLKGKASYGNNTGNHYEVPISEQEVNAAHKAYSTAAPVAPATTSNFNISPVSFLNFIQDEYSFEDGSKLSKLSDQAASVIPYKATLVGKNDFEIYYRKDPTINAVKVATVTAGDPQQPIDSFKPLIKITTERGQEEASIRFQLKIFQESSKKNPLPANSAEEYKAHFTGYDTPAKAEDFLKAYAETFIEAPRDTINFRVTFDAQSTLAIKQALAEIANDPNKGASKDLAESNRWKTLFLSFRDKHQLTPDAAPKSKL